MPAPNKKVKLTNSILESLPPAAPGKRDTIWDTIVPSFCVRVTDKGAVSFAVFRQPRGGSKAIWDTLGKYPALTLAKARESARESVNAMMQGRNPAAERKAAQEAAKLAERQDKEGSFAAVAEKYITQHVRTLKTATPIEQLIRRELTPVLGHRPIHQIKRSEVRAVIEGIRDDYRKIPDTRRATHGGESAAAKALSALSGLFKWAIARDDDDLIAANPCAGIRGSILATPVVRTRTLKDCELRWVWQAANEEGKAPAGTPGLRGRPSDAGGVNGTLLKILMLSGQRLREIGDMKWSEIDFDSATLTIPKERMKMRQEHLVPLTPKVVTLLKSLTRYDGCDYVFSLKGDNRPLNGYDRLKLRLDRRLAEYAGDTEIADWVFHDLRRSVRTGLEKLNLGTAKHPVKVDERVAEAVLAHYPTGIVGRYNLHKYADEKRQALEAWEKRLMTIVEPPAGGGNVVPLRKAG